MKSVLEELLDVPRCAYDGNRSCGPSCVAYARSTRPGETKVRVCVRGDFHIHKEIAE